MDLTQPPRAVFIDGDDFAAYMADTEAHAKVIPAEAYREATVRALFESHSTVHPQLPWAKAHGIAFRPGEVTLWIGTNGSGKSMLVGNATLGWMREGQRVCIGSFEMKPVKQLERYARQFSMGPEPTPEIVGEMLDWMAGHLWFYDQQGTVRPETVYKVCRYSADRLKAQHVILDSLMKIVRGEEDYDAQKNVVDELTAIARDTGLHIHLVHHVRKPSDHASMPSKFDAKGSGAITDQVDNVLIVWRNKPKEDLQALHDAGEHLTDPQRETLKKPDAILACEKQRNGDWEGRIGLWYHRGAQQYCGDERRVCIDFGGGH